MLKYCLPLCGLIILIGCGTQSPTAQRDSAEVPRESMSDSSFERWPRETSELPTEGDAESSSASRSEAHSSSPKLAAGMDAETEFLPESRRQRQSGVLTAGSFDDVSNYGDFQTFLSSYRGHQSQSRLIPGSDCLQTLISVRDEQGAPVGNARCIVTSPDGQVVLLDGRTGSDGRIMLLAATSIIRSTNGLHLRVFAPGTQQAVADVKQSPGSRWNVTVSQADSKLPDRLDLALVIDTTGSMGDELEFLKTEIDSIVESVDRLFPNVDQRYSLITYRDNGDEYVCRAFDFTSSLGDFRRKLDQQSAAGGGDFPEAMDTAMANAEQLSWRPGNTARVMFLIGDAPPHRQNVGKAIESASRLSGKGVRIFPVGASGVETTAQIVMRTAAFLTMGQYLFLTDHSGVGHAHAIPSVPEFAVERLDRLMVRMIASELAGKRLVPEEIIAIERGELQTSMMHVPFTNEWDSQANATAIVVSPPDQSGSDCGPPFAESGRSRLSFGIPGWIGRNGIATLIVAVSAVIVFDSLSSRGARG